MRIVVLTTDNREPHRDYDNPQPHFGPAPEALLQGLAMIPELEVHVVSCIRRRVAAPEKIAPNMYFHSLVVPKIGWMRTLYYGCIRPIRKKLREIQPDIVHGQGAERDCAMSAIYSGFPNVLTIHGNMNAIAETYRARPGSFFWVAARLETFALHRTAGVFCNSAYTESLVAPQARKVWRVANALRRPFFETPLADRPRRPILLNVGMMEPRKQQVQLLQVAGNLWRRGLKFELQFAGNRERQTDYGAAFARELAVAEKAGYARHLGMLPASELISVMDSAAALIHTPKEEAFGLVVAEALARNLKFFGTRTGGMVDIAAGVPGAELFAVNDFSGLETAIADWLTNGCPRPDNAADIMRQRYHPLVIAQRHWEIYREVVGVKRKAESGKRKI